MGHSKLEITARSETHKDEKRPRLDRAGRAARRTARDCARVSAVLIFGGVPPSSFYRADQFCRATPSFSQPTVLGEDLGKAN